MIETERLVLRPWAAGDRDAFVAIIRDPEVNSWLGGPLSASEADAAFDRMLTFWSEHGYGHLAILRHAEGDVVGRVSLRRMPLEWKHPMGDAVEVGWLLARAGWGHGYASEAAAALLPWGFATLDVPVIHSWTARLNLRSQAVMQRIGMHRTPEHDFEHPDLAADNPLRPHIVYVINRPS